MRRLLAVSILAVLAFAALVSSAIAATPKPVISSFSPAKVRIGQTLVINGKNFARGGRNNRVYFRRASDGKTVRAKAKKATTRRIEVVVPPAADDFLKLDASGQKQATRFRLAIFTKTFGPYTRTSRSPLILPANAQVPTSGPVTTLPPPDCDTDGVPDSTDTDDDNDLLTDETERNIGTDPCKKDTDGDGVEDGYEYYSAVDLNGNGIPYPGKRPYPNALDGTDAGKDFDGDGMTLAEEFGAWARFGNHTLPLNYSDGTQYTGGAAPPPAGLEWTDLENNGKISDDEKDVDGDGLGNWIELAKTEKSPPSNGRAPCAFASTTGSSAWAKPNLFTDCGAGLRPNGNTFVPLDNIAFEEFRPDYLDPDSDGDTIPDGADDQDHDGRSNLEEITAGGDGLFTGPQEPCDPDPEAPICERHTR